MPHNFFQTRQTKTGWTISAPAKLNLFFEVLGKRDDGFHEISSLAVPVSLYDTLHFEPADSDISFECCGGSDDVPLDGRNIVVKALEKFRQRYNVEHGAKVKLVKQIPSQAGLGGGSSDAAAALFAARSAWKPEIPLPELSALSAEIGSDCPMFFSGGAVIISGRGEIIEPFDDCPPLHFVIFKPNEGLSTAEVYRQCMPLHDGKIRNINGLLSALRSGSLEDIGRNFFNRLEVPAAAVWNNFSAVKEQLESAGCLAVRMTGSGTAFYGLCRNEEHSEAVAEKLQRQRAGECAAVVKSLSAT
ncbi:MAG: 4-(cytidine 5'-diphospho)-2-C-methyl-D-erythritol kinase [Planctomycetaceae bacterium]|nr:4-(cytidine 5'-diphospho)-2-C-methyl-D-erythritol kinase [Planctomycetaceae bacterium]